MAVPRGGAALSLGGSIMGTGEGMGFRAYTIQGMSADPLQPTLLNSRHRQGRVSPSRALHVVFWGIRSA